ncbi:hypothetical protein [Photobacterium arenosum]|uniref:hypothetical protein n=1 Tax=Photobacterium arenosum TaxID=2774143 RepID=UPI00288C42C8|nr:hypothetical protein [Photobacterium arenosum]
MKATRVIDLLITIGLPQDLLQSAESDWQLRTDLGLSSAETLQLQIQLEQLGCTGFSLWDTHDYSLQELESMISTTKENAHFSLNRTEVNHG